MDSFADIDRADAAGRAWVHDAIRKVNPCTKITVSSGVAVRPHWVVLDAGSPVTTVRTASEMPSSAVTVATSSR